MPPTMVNFLPCHPREFTFPPVVIVLSLFLVIHPKSSPFAFGPTYWSLQLNVKTGREFHYPYQLLKADSNHSSMLSCLVMPVKQVTLSECRPSSSQGRPCDHSWSFNNSVDVMPLEAQSTGSSLDLMWSHIQDSTDLFSLIVDVTRFISSTSSKTPFNCSCSFCRVTFTFNGFTLILTQSQWWYNCSTLWNGYTTV